MTEKELLIDTIEYYSKDTSRRCVSATACFYSPRECNDHLKDGSWYTGDGCAIGRLFKPEDRYRIDQTISGAGYADTTVEILFEIDEVLEFTPGWLQEMDISFLKDLQCLHDAPSHWDSEGLTDEGHNFAETMYKNYSL